MNMESIYYVLQFETLKWPKNRKEESYLELFFFNEILSSYNYLELQNIYILVIFCASQTTKHGFFFFNSFSASKTKHRKIN